MSEETVLPPRDAHVVEAVRQLLAGDGEVELVGADDARTALPVELRHLLATVVEAMRRGQAITIAPLAQRLTTQQAADLLGTSRPTLVKLLEDGRIPYETPGRHRRIRLVDLLEYQAIRRDERRAVLRELTEEAQELGLDAQSSEEYESALGEARAKLASSPCTAQSSTRAAGAQQPLRHAAPPG